MSSRQPSDRFGWVAWAFVPIWASGFIGARWGMPHAPPLSFLAWRFGISFVIFLMWVGWSRPAWPHVVVEGRQTLDRPRLFHTAVSGLLIQVGYLSGVWSAVHWGMGAGLIALIAGLQPLLTAWWVQRQGQERLTWPVWCGLTLGLMGVGLAVSHKLDMGELTVVNGLLALLALISITVGTLYQKKHLAGADVRITQVVQTGVGFVTLGVLSWLEPGGMPWRGQWHHELILALVWSVCVGTVAGNSLLYWLIQRGAATKVTSLLYLVPPTTAGMAWVLFNEPLGWHVLLALAFTATGVWMVHRAGQQRSEIL